VSSVFGDALSKRQTENLVKITIFYFICNADFRLLLKAYRLFPIAEIGQLKITLYEFQL